MRLPARCALRSGPAGGSGEHSGPLMHAGQLRNALLAAALPFTPLKQHAQPCKR